VVDRYGSIATAVEAIHLGAKDYLPKPVDVDDILARVAPFADDKKKMPSDFPPPSLAEDRMEQSTACFPTRRERIRSGQTDSGFIDVRFSASSSGTRPRDEHAGPALILALVVRQRYLD